MAGEERLRLIAEFQNRASSGVNQLKRDLGGIRETPGMNAAQRWMRGFQVDAEKIQRNAAGVGSVMGAMGIGGLAASAGVAAAVGALKSLGDRTIDLQAISRETGIAMTQLKILQNAARGLHVDPSEITKGVQYLTGQLALARRGFGDLYGLLNQVEPEFMRKIMAEDPAKAMDDVLARLARIPQDYVNAGRSLADGIQAQRQWTAKLLGDEGLGRLVEQGPEALARAMANAAKNTKPVTKQMVEAAKAMDESINNLNEKLEGMATKAAPVFFKQVGDIVGEIDQVVTNLDKLQTWWTGAKPGEVGKAVGDAVQDQLTLKPAQKHDRLHREGLFAPADTDDAARARLETMTAEVDAIKKRLAEDKNPVSFPTRHADDFSRLNELAAALRVMREDHPATAIAPAPRPDAAPRVERQTPSTDMREQGLLMLNSYRPDGDRPTLLHRAADRGGEDGGRGGPFGGLGPNQVMLYREIIASGTKLGFLGAFHELQGEKPAEGGGSGGGGGVTLASYGGGGGAGSARYRAAGGRSYAGRGAAPGHFSFAGAPGANGLGLKNAPYTASIDAKGEGGHLSPRELHDYLKLHGATDNEALMLTGAAGSESSYNPRAIHDVGGKNGPGHGLWGHNDHRINMTGLSWQQQADKALDEVKRKYADRVNAAKTPEELAVAEMDYERPRGFHTNNPKGGDNYTGRLNTLRRYGNEFGTMRNGGAQSLGGGSVISDAIGRLKLAGHVASVQCVALANAAVGFSGSVKDWRKGIGAAEGSLKDGTPIATFLNRDGSQSDRYAGGGIGTEGANRDHAAIFRRYLRDAAGKIIGMTVSEQSRGRPIHLRDYRFGQGVGEQNGSNYHAIMGPDGQPLGHGKNPLAWMREEMEKHAVATAQSTAKRVLNWAKKGAAAGHDSHLPRSLPAPIPEAPPRRSLLQAERDAGLGTPVTVKHEGGATVEIRGLPDHKGTRTKTHGMIADVSVRRGRLTPQTG